MSEQEAIKELQDNIDLPFGVDVSDEASKMAIQALEKQIAKKPFQVDSGVYDYPYDYECPSCRKNVDELDHHCECGQKLDWSDENAM